MQFCNWYPDAVIELDSVYILTQLSQEELEAALASLMFDEISEGRLYGKPLAAPSPSRGMAVYSIWWD